MSYVITEFKYVSMVLAARIIDSDEEYKLELKVLYEENQEKIADTNSFEFVIENSFFYAFLNKKKRL